MEQLKGDEMTKLTRDAYTMAAQVFNFFHKAVKKAAKPKVSFTDPALTNETLGKCEKRISRANAVKIKSAKSPTTPTKAAKKDRRKAKVEAKKLDSESSKSDNVAEHEIKDGELLSQAIALSEENGKEMDEEELLRQAIALSLED